MLNNVAHAYLNAGLCVLPAIRAEKRPAIGAWKRYQDRLPTEDELSAWFNQPHDALCILCGSVSNQLEMIDFDAGGELFWTWWDRIPAPLRDRLFIEYTPSGGMHVVYRSVDPVCGSFKLAQRKTNDRVVTLIETRGQGGLFLCSPTLGYELVQGDMANLPVLTTDERDILLQAAHDLNEYRPPVVDELAYSRVTPDASNGDRPGDDYNRRADPQKILLQHGWTLAKDGDNAYWRRPGKTTGWSASLKDGVFYVFSANAAPFEPNRAYSPFAIYALLEHGGDYAKAASTLHMQGYGASITSSATNAPDVDVSSIVSMPEDEAAPSQAMDDPGPMPIDILRVPGFVSEVMDHTLASASYPNPVMAFAGALALQAFLAGRKVRDPGDNRTNLYLLGLAHSGAGKDQSRKVNCDILHAIGLDNCLGLHFASGEGIQDALFQTPAMLFQTDEIDGILESINKARDARYEAIMGTMLTMYSSANSVYPMRRKASPPGTPGNRGALGKSPGVIDQPCLVIYGTAIPNRYYQALSERMLTNGLFARMVILEAGSRKPGQEPSIIDLPHRVLATAKWWADYRPGPGNLEDWHPIPTIVEHSEEAKRHLVETRLEAEAQYSKAEAASDPVGTTVWSRVSEQTRKLALLYAISENHLSPRIGLAAVQWASAFVMHQARRMLFMAASHVADNPFHAECLKLTGKLRDAPGHELSHSVLLKRMKMDAKTFGVLIETMAQQGDIEVVTVPRAGTYIRSYRLACGVKPGGESWDGGET